MKKVSIFYLLNKEGQKEDLLNNGTGKELRVLETELTKEILDLKSIQISEAGDCYLTVGFYASIYNIETESLIKENSCKKDGVLVSVELAIDFNGRPYEKTKETMEHFPRLMTATELIAWEKARLLKVEQDKEEIQEKYQELLNEYNIKKEMEMKKREEEKAQRILSEKQRNEAIEQKREQQQKDRENWIKNNGSKYLKDCLELGYECQRKYVEERSVIEHPEFVLDFDNVSEWNERIGPSEEAISEIKILLEQGNDAEIVWLTKYIDTDEEYFAECEAVIIKEYLGKYTLVNKI